MGFYTGRTGKLEFWSGSSYKPVAKIRDWTLNSTVELLSTTVVDSIASTFTPGIKSATGSATLLYYRLESGESDEDKKIDIIEALDWCYEDALGYLNDNTRDGFYWEVEDQSLYLVEDADASQ